MTLKLMISIGGLLIMTAGLGAFAIFEVSVVGKFFGDYRANARQSIGLAAAQETLAETRLNVMKYRISQNEDAANAVFGTVKGFGEKLAVVRELGNDSALSEELSKIEAEARDYGQIFSDAWDWQKKRNGAVSIINAVGPAVRTNLTDLGQIAFEEKDLEAVHAARLIQEGLLLGRLYAAKFLVDNNPTDMDRARQELASALETASDLSGKLAGGDQKRLVNLVQQGLKTYLSSLGQVEETILERNKLLIGGLDTLGPKMFGDISSLARDAIDNQNRIGPLAQAEVEIAESRTLMISVLIVVSGAILGWILASHIKGGIQTMTKSMRAIADGNLSTEVPFTKYKDELGEMAETLSVFKSNAEEIRKSEELEQQRRTQAEAEKRAAMNDLAEKFEREVGNIVNEVTESAQKLRSTSSELNAAVEETSGRSGSANEAVQKASSNVQAVAAATEELAAGVDEVSRSVTIAAQMARSSAAGAEQAGVELKELRRSISEVDAIILSINEVAEQTNLLALNATIEAARAGEAGKGFTVVANEVKTLAAQTKTMTDGISNKVDAVKTAAFKAIEATESIISEVRKIDETTTEMAASVEQQSSATTEISRNAQEAAVGTNTAEENVVNVQSANHQTEVATGQVSDAASLLTKHSENLKRQVSTFLAEVRAA